MVESQQQNRSGRSCYPLYRKLSPHQRRNAHADSFHQATENPRYLKAIEESTKAHPIAKFKDGLSQLFVLAYLQANGVTGLPDYAVAKKTLATYLPHGLPEPAEIRQADYQTLRTLITTQLPPAGNPMYRETAHIGRRAVEYPLLLEGFGLQTSPMQTP